MDLARFDHLDEEAREKSRKAHKTASQQFDQNFFSDFTRAHKPTEFEGFHKTALDTHVLGMVVDGKFVDEISEGQTGLLILEKTPFYAEMGGQVGDAGQIAKGGHVFMVYDTTAPFPGVIAHLGQMKAGTLRKNDPIHAAVDAVRRQEIQNNHTATHLLHWALQKVLGPHIKQAGSLVDAKRLRFDFSHHKGVSPLELREIENLVNEKIRSDAAVNTYELSYDDAQKRSDIKQFFGEKYGSKVRVVDIDFSKELCGGTHTARVGTIGFFKIVKESSIAAGVRRIEAVTGKHAEMFVQQEEDLLHSLAEQLKSSTQALPERFQSLLDENKHLAQELKAARKGQLKQLLDKCLSHKEKAGSISFIAEEVAVASEDLTAFAEDLLLALKSGVVALGARMGERCQLLVAVSPDWVAKNIHAQSLIKEAAILIQGGGGGKQNLAQAGGKDPQGLPQALDKIRDLLKEAKC